MLCSVTVNTVQVSQPSIYYSNEGNLYISVCLCLGLSIGPHDISFDHWKEGSDNGCVINWSSGEKLPAGVKHSVKSLKLVISHMIPAS